MWICVTVQLYKCSNVHVKVGRSTHESSSCRDIMMKRTFCVVTICICLLSGAARATEGLVAYYPFNGNVEGEARIKPLCALYPQKRLSAFLTCWWLVNPLTQGWHFCILDLKK